MKKSMDLRCLPKFLKLYIFLYFIALSHASDIQEQSIAQELQQILQKHEQLLNSSVGKEIVLFIGQTGSGKSSSINFLNNIPLMVNEFDQISLIDPTNPKSMQIGHGFNSKTEYPKAIQSNEFIYYDMPGIGDTKGTIQNLANGLFYKDIAEKASAVRIVFVASEDDLSSNRGEVYKKLIQNTQKLFPNNNVILQSSLLLITKCTKKTTEKLINLIQHKHNQDKQDGGDEIDKIMKLFLNPERISIISKELDPSQRDEILQKLRSLRAVKVNFMNIQAIYEGDVRKELGKLFSFQMTESLRKIEKNYVQVSSLDSIDETKNYYRQFLKQDIIKDLESSTTIQFLRPLLQDVYDHKLRKFFSTTVEDLIASKIKYLDQKSLLLAAERREQEQREQTSKQTGTAVLTTAGAVVGAMIGGPLGAAIGGGVGKVVADFYGGILGLFLRDRLQ